MFDYIQSYFIQGIPAVLFLLFLVLIVLAFRAAYDRYPKAPNTTDEAKFKKLIHKAGYAYDPVQGIFYSRMDAWQKKYGYCRLYDEAAAPSGMILDSEPVYFKYGGKRWLVQFWKGQYYLNTGCEIGIYYSEGPDLDIPGFFNGTFYKCVEPDDRIDMAFYLYKNGRELFYRDERHWWLTGFKTGEFSEPWELSMLVRLTFREAGMCRSFVRAMRKIGYQEYEISTNGVTVEFLFNRPRTPQPLTRNEETDWIIQRNNERVCSRFMEITGKYDKWEDKLKAIREQEPLLYDAVINMGKTRQIFKSFGRLKRHLRGGSTR
jgi:hypothetical protein